ncbi:MAG: metalloregulator ArsR/SmtB family transcription factor [Candidatus Altiarchaeota archaeon]
MAKSCDAGCPDEAKSVKNHMLNPKDAKDASSRLKLLAHPTRLQILKILSKKDQCVCVFSDALGKRQPNISQHLAKLKDNGIIESYMKGKYAYYSLKDKKIRKLVESI